MREFYASFLRDIFAVIGKVFSPRRRAPYIDVAIATGRLEVDTMSRRHSRRATSVGAMSEKNVKKRVLETIPQTANWFFENRFLDKPSLCANKKAPVSRGLTTRDCAV